MDMKRALAVLIVALCAVSSPRMPLTAAAGGPTIDQFLMPGYPTEIVSARKVDRLAWTAYEHGQRNVYTAAAPAFNPVRLTSFLKDDGV